MSFRKGVLFTLAVDHCCVVVPQLRAADLADLFVTVGAMYEMDGIVELFAAR